MTSPEIHLFRAGRLSLAFAPVTDSLVLVDDAGWETLELAAAGAPADRIRRKVAAGYGAEGANRCLGELEALVAERDLAAPDPLARVGTAAGSGIGTGVKAEPGAASEVTPGNEWLPSPPGAPLLRSLCLNVAHDCDLRCRYCFAGTGGFGGKRGLMSREVARAAVDFLLANSGAGGPLEIDFFGGEPLFNLDVVRETVDYGRRRGAEAGRRFGFTLTTNAASMGPDEAGYLAETMDNVVLSLDGRPEVHDRMRPLAGGSPSHRAVLENVLRFIALRGDRDYWVRGTYTALNLGFVEDVAYLARQGIRNISLEPVVGGPAGAGGAASSGGLASEGGPASEGGREWGLREAHVPRLREEYLRLATFLESEARAGRPIRFFHFLAETDSGPCYAKRVRGCGAGREYLAVTPDGELYPCHQFVGRAGFGLGRVGGFVSGFRPADGPGRRVGTLWLGSKPACRSCWARYRCSGGCHANAHSATGDLLRPDPLGCAILKARLEASLYLQALGATRAA